MGSSTQSAAATRRFVRCTADHFSSALSLTSLIIFLRTPTQDHPTLYLCSDMQRVTLFAGTLPIAYTDAGKGTRTIILLHGGAGPRSMQSLATALSSHNYRTITPVHPGFDNEPRPAYLMSVRDLATAYLALLDQLGVSDVIVVGNSMGGWLVAEMASRSPSRIGGFVLVNGVGIDTDGTDLTILNPFTVPPEQRAAAAWHDPSNNTMLVPPQGGAAMATMQNNQKAVAVYGGGDHFCYDPTLRGRLSGGAVSVPVLVLWGESDRIVTVEYGRRYVDVLGKHARLEVVKEAGHFPHLEKPEVTLKLITEFVQQTPIVGLKCSEQVAL